MFVTFARIVTYLENMLLAVSIICLLTIATIVMLVLAERAGLGVRIPDNVILMQQLMVVAVGCSLAYVTRTREHISIDLLYVLLGSRLRRLADLGTIIIGLLASTPIAYWAFVNFRKSVASGAYYFGEINLPEWPAKFFFFLAFTTVALRLLILLVQFFRDQKPPVVDTNPDKLGVI